MAKNKKEIIIPFIRPNFKRFNIKHSYNLKDSEKYERSQIILSSERVCVNFDLYSENPPLKRIIHTELPDYISDEISSPK